MCVPRRTVGTGMRLHVVLGAGHVIRSWRIYLMTDRARSCELFHYVMNAVENTMIPPIGDFMPNPSRVRIVDLVYHCYQMPERLLHQEVTPFRKPQTGCSMARLSRSGDSADSNSCVWQQMALS